LVYCNKKNLATVQPGMIPALITPCGNYCLIGCRTINTRKIYFHAFFSSKTTQLHLLGTQSTFKIVISKVFSDCLFAGQLYWYFYIIIAESEGIGKMYAYKALMRTFDPAKTRTQVSVKHSGHGVRLLNRRSWVAHRNAVVSKQDMHS
jgi:hypothetical protein